MGMILNGVLRMPPSCWSDDELDVYQRYSRYREAADLIEKQQAEIETLRIDAERYRKLRNCGTPFTHGPLVVMAEPERVNAFDGEELDKAIDAMEAADAKPQ